MYEIGSEFPEDSVRAGINRYVNLVCLEKRYVLSGRTAIAYIIEDILSYSELRRVALPDYCCASMIKPFWSKRIEVIFYTFYSEYEEIFGKVEAVLVMDYFGMESDFTVTAAKLCKKMNKILIVDATQTAFSQLKTYCLADYILASYRKWTDCLCAAVYSKRGFGIEPPKQDNDQFVMLWREAAKMKKNYIQYNQENKIKFLQSYKRANELLNIKYESCAAPVKEVEKFETIDSDYIRKCRRSNAMILIEKLAKIVHSEQSRIQLIYKKLSAEDCPLFVPILVNEEKRDIIRQRLISRNIYCPVHWPIDEKYPYVKTRYHDREISLICDQRYNSKAMLREVEEVMGAIFDS